jgi:(S)-ureidoglycine aminohydrolase
MIRPIPLSLVVLSTLVSPSAIRHPDQRLLTAARIAASDTLTNPHAPNPGDTLTARVCHWNSLETKKDSSRDRKEILEGRTPDLSMLEIHASTLGPGMAPHPPHTHSDMEELLIVKAGTLRATINGVASLLGPGSIALALPGDEHGFVNAGTTNATYYVLKFQTGSMLNTQRGRASGGSFTINWDTLAIQPTDRGEKREVFDRSTALFKRLELHATTLNPGRVSHAPHTHKQEEIILLRSGNVEMQIGDKFYPASAGDLVFLSSGILHALRNTGSGPCQYFALQWQE